MKIYYETEKDCKFAMIAKYVKCCGAAVLVGSLMDAKIKPWAKAIAGGFAMGAFFKNAVEYGQILQIKDTAFKKGEKK